jgi:hypothetical protein
MKEALGTSETSDHTRATWRNTPEDTILHSHRRENLKSYIVFLYGRLLIEKYGDCLRDDEATLLSPQQLALTSPTSERAGSLCYNEAGNSIPEQ